MGLFKLQTPRLALTIAFLSLIVCMFVVAIVSIPLGLDPYKQDYIGLLSSQIVSSIIIFGGAVMISVVPMYGNIKRIQGNRPASAPSFLLAIMIILACEPLTEWAYYVNSMIVDTFDLHSIVKAEENVSEFTAKLIDFSSPTRIISTILVIVVLPAILEEAYFRGIVQKGMCKVLNNQNNILAVLLSAAIFSLVHGETAMFLPRMILGIVLGALYVRTHNIWTCITAHAANNLIAVITIAIADTTVLEALQNQPAENPGPLYPILSLIGTSLLLMFIRLTHTHNTSRKISERIRKSIDNDLFE